MSETFGDRLRKLREEKGLSQYAAARKMLIHPNCLYRYENDISVPDGFFLSILAGFYGVSMDYLWNGKNKIIHCKDCNHNGAEDYDDKVNRPKPCYCRKQCRWKPDNGFCDEAEVKT